MDRRLGCLVLATALVAAGCIAPAGGERAVGAAEAPAAGQSPPADGQVAERYGPNTTVVAVEATGDRVPPVGPVARATTHWEREAGDRTYVVATDPPDPDVVLRVASEPLECEPRNGPRRDGPAYYCAVAPDGGDGPAVGVLSPGLTDDGYESAATAALGRLAGVRAPLSDPDIDEPTFADPWPASDPVTVRIVNEADPDRDVDGLVREAIRYWEANDERWGTYAVDWTLVDDRDADVTIAVVETIERCGGHPDPGSLIGCAPVRSPENLADGDERVRVKGGYGDETTRTILKHELGHLYGLSHGDEPTDVMVDSISTSLR